MIKKSCIVWDLTDTLIKMQHRGILERGLKQIADMNTAMSHPDYMAYGEFRFLTAESNTKGRRNILVFYDARDRKPNIKTKKFISKSLYFITKGTAAWSEREKPINLKHAFDLDIPYRIICGIDKKENSHDHVVQIIGDLINTQPISIAAYQGL